jgi:hypothetical protein
LQHRLLGALRCVQADPACQSRCRPRRDDTQPHLQREDAGNELLDGAVQVPHQGDLAEQRGDVAIRGLAVVSPVPDAVQLDPRRQQAGVVRLTLVVTPFDTAPADLPQQLPQPLLEIA